MLDFIVCMSLSMLLLNMQRNSFVMHKNYKYCVTSQYIFQVTWDEPELLKNMKTVSPWQVEYVADAPIHGVFPLTKRFKGAQEGVRLTDGEGEISFSSIAFSSMMDKYTPSSYINYNNIPAGMQGARQIPFPLPSSSPIIINDGSSRQRCPDDNVDISQKVVEAQASTDPNVASSYETSSPESSSSVQLPSKGFTSFQLFGKVIQTELPLLEAPHIELPHIELPHMGPPFVNRDDISCTECDDYTTEGARNTVDNSLSETTQSQKLPMRKNYAL